MPSYRNTVSVPVFPLGVMGVLYGVPSYRNPLIVPVFPFNRAWDPYKACLGILYGVPECPL